MSTTKNSKQKEAILRVLRGTKTHPNADWIYSQVRRELPNISLGTVYRNLSRFSEDGTIAKLNIGTGTEHFDGTATPHYHLVCRQCGGIFDLPMAYQTGLDQAASTVTGGRVEQHALVFHGICAACRDAH